MERKPEWWRWAIVILAFLLVGAAVTFMGGIVGSMIIALYMPIFKVFDLIKA